MKLSVYCPNIHTVIAGLTNAFAKGAKLNGAAIFEDCPVSNINLNTTNSVQSVSVGNDKVPALCTYSIMWDYCKDTIYTKLALMP